MGLDIPMSQKFFISQNAKADLHRVVQHHLSATEVVFARFDYPNVTPANNRNFYQAIVDMVQASECLEPHPKMMLRGILEMGMRLEPSGLLGGEDANTLLDSFDKFYAERIMLFKNSTIIFDNETRISERLGGPAYEEMIGVQKNYQFTDSKSNIFVQLSDLIIGIVGKYFSFLNTHETHEVAQFLSILSSAQQHNLKNLKRLIDASDAQCNAFYHYVISAHLSDKNRLVWEFLG